MTEEQRAAALRLADELESVARNTWSNNDAAELLRALAAEPVAEPVAWLDDFGNAFPLGAVKGAGSRLNDHRRNWKPLYMHPQDTALREAADDVLTFCGDVVDGWESLAPLRVRSAASESLLRLKAALEAK